MQIEIGSTWVKDNEMVDVLFYDFICTIDEYFSPWAVVFKGKHSHGVLAVKDFLEQYKPYEPVYEYMFMYQLDDCKIGEWHLHTAFYTIVEDCMNYTTRNAYNFQRLDFTKRERKG